MATTTPNFGWDIPQSTDLVKDGATAIAALGNDIDTSMVDLKGGTTGQILTKASNTDMDFTWSSETDPNAISKTIVAAKGDIIGASANDTPAVTSVGSNGYTLVADSSAATGLAYSGNMAAGKNYVVNGGFDIWQRGTSFSVTSGWIYTADRWQSTEGAGTWTLARESTVVPTGSQYSLKLTSGGTTTGQIATLVETANVTALQGQTVTISAKVAASTSIPMQFLVYYSTTADDNITNTGTAISASSGGTATPTSSTFVNMVGTYGIPSTAKTLQIRIASQGNMTSGQIFYVGQVQMELGSSQTTFTRAGGTIQGELAACQRYYYQMLSGNSLAIGLGTNLTATTAVASVSFPVTMRTAPTLSASSGTSYYIFERSSDTDFFNSFTINRAQNNGALIFNNSEISGTQGVGGTMYTNNASASIAFSAEL